MEDLTYVCIQMTATRSRTTFRFYRTVWSIASGDPDDLTFEDAHFTDPDAEPYSLDDQAIEIVADADAYEVGYHYAFTPLGPLVVPGNDDQ